MNLFAELLSALWHAIGAQPLLAYALASVGIGLALGAYLRARFSRLTIKIISPARGAWVPPVYYVHGSISPQRAPLQVFVHSPATNKWHLQAPVEWEDAVHWRARCCFEDENAVPGADFKIVAISSRLPIPEPQDELRTNARQSKIINVSRRQVTVEKPPQPGAQPARLRRVPQFSSDRPSATKSGARHNRSRR